jgi:aspartyl-tRNA(Asn)/glutamyl-tRNA(Gln) amidotransferase subunit A
MSQITELSAVDLAEQIRSKRVGAEEATRAYLERIERIDPKLNSFITVDAEGALAAAQKIDAQVAHGAPLGPLAGVPLALKDIFVTDGLRTTCASKILANWLPPFEGTPSARLRDAGAVILGKLNMDEFAMGSSNENSAFGPCRNPWDLERVPGGSSGGAAAAVAARLCAGALGTDTGGSIRQPAALCGVVGIKPTYGRVSRYGVVAFASSLDQVGPICRTVEDAALLLEVIAGHDPRDSTSLPKPVGRYREACAASLAGVRVGVPREYFGGGSDAQVDLAVRRAIDELAALGAEPVEVSLPHTEYAVATYYLICTAEASSNLARYDGVRYGLRADQPADLLQMYRQTRHDGFGAEVKRRILIGTFALSAGYYDAYYGKAQRVRTLIRRDFERAFEQVDVIAAPTSPLPAFRLGERVDDPLKMYLADIFTISANLAGLPGLALPCGFTAEGLPIGLQLLGPALGEEVVFKAASAYQAATEWHQRRPPEPEPQQSEGVG